jgi:hypothetical protein
MEVIVVGRCVDNEESVVKLTLQMTPSIAASSEFKQKI